MQLIQCLPTAIDHQYFMCLNDFFNMTRNTTSIMLDKDLIPSTYRLQ